MEEKNKNDDLLILMKEANKDYLKRDEELMRLRQLKKARAQKIITMYGMQNQNAAKKENPKPVEK